MKKKFLSLTLGVLALVSLHAQTLTPAPAGTFTPGPGQVLFNGSVMVAPSPTVFPSGTPPAGGSTTALSYNTVFTYNGLMWGITPVPVPNLTPQINGSGNQLTNFLNVYFLVPVSSIPASALAQLNSAFFITISGTQYAQLANANGTLGVTPVPFDLNLMMILGIGAMGAVYAARRRRQEMLMA